VIEMGKVLSRNGQNNKDGTFDWKDAICDAAIASGTTFFTTLGAGSAAGLPTREMVIASAISAAAQFFIWLSIKRGLREKQ